MAPKVVHLLSKFGETLAKAAKFVTSLGLHVSWQIMKTTITYQLVVIIERNFVDRFLRKHISAHQNFVVKVTVLV